MQRYVTPRRADGDQTTRKKIRQLTRRFVSCNYVDLQLSYLLGLELVRTGLVNTTHLLLGSVS